MRSIAGLAAAAIVAGSAFAALPAHSADRVPESVLKSMKSAHSEFLAGRSLYDKGHFADGLAVMERSLLKLQETMKKVLPVPFGSLQNILVKFYISHGCYDRAATLAEEDMGFLRTLPVITEMHDNFLLTYAAAVRGSGQRERAIGLYNDLLKSLRRPNGDKWLILRTLLHLAELYGETGDIDRGRRVASEARVLFEERWQRKPPSDHTRRYVEILLLRAEGRDEEARKLILQDLDAGLQSLEARSKDTRRLYGAIARSYEQLATIYQEKDDADLQLTALKNALRYHEAYLREFPDAVPNPETGKLKGISSQRMRFKVIAALGLAKSYMSLGMHGPAESLAKEYRLCLE